MNSKPIVSGLEAQFANRVRVVRVDLFTPPGRDLAARYQFTFTPFFVGLDSGGELVWRQAGLPPTANLFDQLASQ